MSRITAKSGAPDKYPDVTFDHDQEKDTLTITVGDVAPFTLTTSQTAALFAALTQVVAHDNVGRAEVVAHDNVGRAEGTRPEEPGQEVPAG